MLLLGESGTGKELVARAVHEASDRAASPLVVVDCASLPETLFESELFGHERGAFTGASASKRGLVEAADGGTLFLDEVGDIPLTLQVKLLRLLESGTYRRVGSTDLRRADVRVVSATHRDLRAMIARGRFREDLYYRLSTFPIRLPSLRERVEDIPLLAETLLSRVSGRSRRLALSADALRRLMNYPFPGNVRELRNVLERAALLCDGQTIEAEHIEQSLADVGGTGERATPSTAGGPAKSKEPLLKEIELSVLRERLAHHRGTRAQLARELGLSERSLYRKLRALKSAG